MVVDLYDEKIKALAAEIGSSQCMYSALNVLDEVNVRQSITKLTEHWGPLNCVVNCAGKPPLY